MRKAFTLLAVSLLLSVAANAQQSPNWQFVKVFPDTNLSWGSGINNTIAVDKLGRIWLASYSASVDSIQRADGTYKKCGVLRIYNPDGSQASFSPIKTVTTGGVTDTLGYGYGMAVDPNGNILLVKPSNMVIRINYKDGTGMNRVVYPIPGYTGSLASVAVDTLGEVFLQPVLPGAPAIAMSSDFSSVLATIDTSMRGYARTLAVSKDGNYVYLPRFDKKTTYVYYCPNGTFGPYQRIDSIFTGLVNETMGWDPKTGWLWAGSGNKISGYPDPPYTAYRWYAYSFKTKSIVDSIVWNGDVSTDPRPRGIAFSPSGDTVYLAAFSISKGFVQMFKRLSVPNAVKDRQPDQIPASYTLSQNYPNPFNPSTNIDYTLKSGGKVTLKVYDLLGREIATLVDGIQSAGEHTVRFDGTNLPSGIYIYVLSTPDGLKLTKKMALMK
ncbi:MAG: T9SS type A sorting domain-containing protein [Candidatus Kryptoniota bacterium]